jgi:glucose-1-phosphate thymidylyltransferase
MRVLILAAGYAVRLFPLTRDRPKALLPVGGIPIIQRIMQKLVNLKGLRRVHIVSNHKFISHFHKWLGNFLEETHLPFPVGILDDMTTSNEDKLGAIGDIVFTIENARINDDLLVIAGDNLFEFDLQDFVDFARKNGSSIVLAQIESKELLRQYGCVELDEKGRVKYFEEKSPMPRSNLVSAGIYYFLKKHLPLINTYIQEGHIKDAPGFFIQWFYKKVDLYGYPIKGVWFDIGDIDSYNRANELYTTE